MNAKKRRDKGSEANRGGAVEECKNEKGKGKCNTANFGGKKKKRKREGGGRVGRRQ